MGNYQITEKIINEWIEIKRRDQNYDYEKESKYGCEKDYNEALYELKRDGKSKTKPEDMVENHVIHLL